MLKQNIQVFIRRFLRNKADSFISIGRPGNVGHYVIDGEFSEFEGSECQSGTCAKK
jgi:hypothetical protein